MAIPTLLTIKNFCKKHDSFPPGGIRNWIFYEEINGLKESGSIIRVGKKILINEEKFFDWVTNQV